MAQAGAPLGRARQSTVFLAGCLMGCVLSTMLYVWVSGALYGISYNQRSLFEDGAAPTLKQETLHLYLSAIGSLVSPIEKQLGRPSSLSLEYRPRKVVLRAVLTSRDKLNITASLINETWGSEFKDYWIFVGGAEEIPEQLRKNHPIWPLSSMVDIGADVDQTPPLLQTFTMLKVLHNHYIDKYKWFFIVPDNTYISSNDMEVVLSRMDSSQVVYMGRPASDHPMEMARMKLITNEFYCERGPGIVLSSRALDAIVPHLDDCLSQVRAYANENQLTLDRVDVELGRCFSRKLDTRCSSSREALNYFVHDGDGQSIDPSRLWYNPRFSDLLSLYPIHNGNHMRSVHHFVTARQFHTLTQRVLKTEKVANQVCRTLPKEYSTPASEVSDRSCALSAFNACTVQPPLKADLLPKPFYPLNKYELMSWQYFDPRNLYTSGTTMPVQEIFGENEAEFQYILKKAVQAINRREAEEYKYQSVVNGYVRYSATQGREYILDLLLASKHTKVQRRVNILRVHQPELILLPDSGPGDTDEAINMIVPLSQVNERFSEFLSMYEELCLKTGENVRLILAVFGGEEDQHFISKSMNKYAQKYPEFKFTILIGKDTFSRGRALDLGMSILNDSELAFLCDVDMTINQPFLNRCRMNAVRRQRVYYPEFFKYYNMDYVYRFKRKPMTYRIKREHGHWASYSYGMVCMYKEDYEAIGGFNKGIIGWGGEDVDLFMKVLRRKLQVLKAPDPALSHRYHDKYCSAKLAPTQFQMCLSSRNEGLADRMQLAEYVLYLESQYSESGRTLWH